MTSTQLERIRRRHNTSPIGDWRVEPIRNVTAFVSIVDHAGAVAPEITPDDATHIRDAHTDRGALLAELEAARSEIEHLRSELAKTKYALTDSRRLRAKARTKWCSEKAHLQTQLDMATSPAAAAAPYKAALAELLNVKWEARNVGGVPCARPPYIPLANLVRLRKVLGDHALPTEQRREVAFRALAA